MSVACKACGRENKPGSAFCEHCGKRLTVMARQCPNGHTLEPGSVECVYCLSDTLTPMPTSSAPPQRAKTVIVDAEPGPVAGRPPVVAGRPPAAPRPAGPPPQGAAPAPASSPQPYAAPPMPAAAPPVRKTQFYVPDQQPTPAPSPQAPPPNHPASPQKTRFASAEPEAAAASGGAVPARGGRKVVGVLLTHSWRPEGDLYPVYEGRNVIGRGEECDICVPNDASLSGRHSHISYAGRFVIGDLVSMSGTHLNDQPVLSQFEPLPDTAKLRTGSTTWLFVSLVQFMEP